MNYSWNKIKQTLTKELKPIFDDPNQPVYPFSFDDGLDMLYKALAFKTGDTELDGIFDKLIPTIDKYYHQPKDKNDSFNYLTQIGTKLDTYLQKIVFLFFYTDYVTFKSSHKGMMAYLKKSGINKNSLLLNNPIGMISPSDLSTNFGQHLHKAYSLRNTEAHTATDYNDDEIPVLIKNSLVIYLFTTFEYYLQLQSSVGHIVILDEIKITEVVRELTASREYEIELSDLIGRNDDLDRLNNTVTQNDKIVVLNGIGGMGKTTLVKGYIKTLREDLNHIIWISFRDNLVQSFTTNLSLIENLGLAVPDNMPVDQLYLLIMNSLRKLPGKAIIAIDNLQEDTSELLEQLPLSPNCIVIATSRMKLLNSLIKLHEVGGLDFTASKELFAKYYTGNIIDAELQELLTLIGNHTLSIELLAKTLETNFTINSIKELTAYLDERSIGDEGWQVSVRSDYSDNEASLKTHLLNTFDLVALNELEKQLLLYFSILPTIEFTGEELVRIFDIEQSKVTGFIDCISSLVRKGWIKEINRTYQLHAIVQEVIRMRIPADFNNCAFVIEGLNKCLDVNPSSTQIPEIKIISSAETVLSLITNPNNSVLRLNFSVAIALKELGNYNAGLKYAYSALAIAVETDDIHQTYQCHSMIGMLNRLTGNLVESLKSYETAIEMIESLSERYITSVVVYSNLATLLEQLGNREHLFRAKELYETAIRDLKQFILNKDEYKEEQIHLALTQGSLGKIHILLGNYKPAVSLQQSAFDELSKLLSENHPSIGVAANNLALAYSHLANYDKSLKYYQLAISIEEKLFDHDHPRVSITQSGLANLYIQTGKLTEAKKILKEVLDSGLRTLPEMHPTLARRKANYASVCNLPEESDYAKQLYLEAIQIDEYNYGKNNPDVGLSNMNLGTLFFSEGNFPSAYKHFKAAYKIFLDNYDDKHPYFITTRNFLLRTKELLGYN